MFCCVRGYGGRRTWRSMLLPAHGTPFPFRPLQSGQLGVGRLACGLFIVGSLSCNSLVGSRLCSPRRCSRTWFLLSSWFVLRVAAAGLSGAVDVLRPGRTRCVVLVRRCWVASGRPVWVVCCPVWARPAVFGCCSCPYVACFPSGMLFRGVPGFGTSSRVVVVLLALLWLVRHRLRRPIASLSCRWMCWAVAVV